MAPFVILDRDGVINADSPDYIKSASEWLPLPGSVEAIARLTAAGCQVFVATNQAGIARGKLSLAALEAIHQRMIAEVADAGGLIVDIQYCHIIIDQCQCRKPQPGMLLTLAARHDLDSGRATLWDSAKDLEAAAAADCQGVLVLTGNGKETLRSFPDHQATFTDLAEFVDHLLLR